MVAVQEMVDRMKAALESAKSNLTAAQIGMQEYADRCGNVYWAVANT